MYMCWCFGITGLVASPWEYRKSLLKMLWEGKALILIAVGYYCIETGMFSGASYIRLELEHRQAPSIAT